MASNFVTFTSVSGGTLRVGYSQVAFVRADPSNTARAFIGLHTQEEPVYVVRTPALVCADFAAAIAYPAVVGQPTAPFAPLPQFPATLGSVYITQPGCALIRADPTSNARCYVESEQSSSTTFRVALSPSATQALLEAQGNGQPGGGASAGLLRLLWAGAVNGTTGALEPGFVTDYDITLTPGAYVPGSGTYAFVMTGTQAPSDYLAVIEPIQSTQANHSVSLTGSPSFGVDFRRADRAIARGKVDIGGAPLNGYGLASIGHVPGSGIYDFQVSPVPSDPLFLPFAVPEGFTRTVEYGYLGAGQFRITLIDPASGLPNDSGFSLTVESADGSPVDGTPPIEPPAFTVLIVGKLP